MIGKPCRGLCGDLQAEFCLVYGLVHLDRPVPGVVLVDDRLAIVPGNGLTQAIFDAMLACKKNKKKFFETPP
ncbi:hypothetical protein [Roseivivax lentus]|uniref:hypothetical protein n=1 Tax=Roseivivax lentus TaxID=633194 RepID=UPI001179FE27|nr:hypothetical protein [Roseivivax lentus]